MIFQWFVHSFFDTDFMWNLYDFFTICRYPPVLVHPQRHVFYCMNIMVCVVSHFSKNLTFYENEFRISWILRIICVLFFLQFSCFFRHRFKALFPPQPWWWVLVFTAQPVTPHTHTPPPHTNRLHTNRFHIKRLQSNRLFTSTYFTPTAFTPIDFTLTAFTPTVFTTSDFSHQRTSHQPLSHQPSSQQPLSNQLTSQQSTPESMRFYR